MIEQFLKTTPREYAIESELTPAGLCIRYSTGSSEWRVGYGSRNKGKYTGFGKTIEDAIVDFRLKQSKNSGG